MLQVACSFFLTQTASPGKQEPFSSDRKSFYDENFSYIRSFHASPRMNLLSRGVDEREYLPWMSD